MCIRDRSTQSTGGSLHSMDDLRNALGAADSSLKESISSTRTGVNSVFGNIADVEQSVADAAHAADQQYEDQVKGLWAGVKDVRAQYPGLLLGAVALGIGLPSARYGVRTLIRNTLLAGSATYVVMYPQLWGKPN
eukprot:TRINITY_DN6262_c0_g1_i7.p1 TRINITY_DN6262_c0_g1~~TRINITY_DN6262_c0_g1_i7.p1  ORF type:complete len:135 (-),score=31.40 TRINITY_DN6262_c0_g1_i7:273-677(-)